GGCPRSCIIAAAAEGGAAASGRGTTGSTFAAGAGGRATSLCPRRDLLLADRRTRHAKLPFLRRPRGSRQAVLRGPCQARLREGAGSAGGRGVRAWSHRSVPTAHAPARLYAGGQ